MDRYDDPLEDEPMEPTLNAPVLRIAVFFTAEEPREVVDQVIQDVIDFAEQNGLVFDWGAVEVPAEPTTPPTTT
jgi:hypothetical protein